MEEGIGGGCRMLVRLDCRSEASKSNEGEVEIRTEQRNIGDGKRQTITLNLIGRSHALLRVVSMQSDQMSGVKLSQGKTFEFFWSARSSLYRNETGLILEALKISVALMVSREFSGEEASNRKCVRAVVQTAPMKLVDCEIRRGTEGRGK